MARKTNKTKERRRLQRFGIDTLYVSIPRFWARAHDIGKGTTVEVDTDEKGNLLIKPGVQEGKDEAAQ